MGQIKPPGRTGELARIRAESRREVFDPMSLMKEQAMRRAAMPNLDRRPDVVHPSEMAKSDWCIRATYYRMVGMPQPDREFSWVLENIFEFGNTTHTWFQSLLTDTNELFGSWKCLICDKWVHNVTSGELDRDEECVANHTLRVSVPHMWQYEEVRLQHGIIAGKSDGGIRDTMLEFKTVGMGTLRIEAPKTLKKYYIDEVKLYNLDLLWKDLRRPFPSHIRQGNVYLYLAHQNGLTQFQRMTYVYQFKANQQTKSFQVSYSEEIMRPLLAKVGKIQSALDVGLPPACEFGGCEQCTAYEEDGDDKVSKGEDREPEREARRVITRGSARAGEAEARESSRTAGRRVPRTARGTDRAARPRADGPDDEAQPVGRVSRVSAQRRPGGRTVRGTSRRDHRSARSGPR